MGKYRLIIFIFSSCFNLMGYFVMKFWDGMGWDGIGNASLF